MRHHSRAPRGRALSKLETCFCPSDGVTRRGPGEDELLSKCKLLKKLKFQLLELDLCLIFFSKYRPVHTYKKLQVIMALLYLPLGSKNHSKSYWCMSRLCEFCLNEAKTYIIDCL